MAMAVVIHYFNRRQEEFNPLIKRILTQIFGLKPGRAAHGPAAVTSEMVVDDSETSTNSPFPGRGVALGSAIQRGCLE